MVNRSVEDGWMDIMSVNSKKKQNRKHAPKAPTTGARRGPKPLSRGILLLISKFNSSINNTMQCFCSFIVEIIETHMYFL